MSAGCSEATPASATTIKEHELRQVDRANTTGLQPVVFVHYGRSYFQLVGTAGALLEKAGFTALTPGWPDDPDTVAEANAHPEFSRIRQLVR
jgi:non-heme chloroperoxidase